MVVPAPSIDEESEEQPRGDDAIDGNSSDEELVLSPLLSPTITTNQSLGASPPVHPPLFLRLCYCLKQMPAGSEEERRERDKAESVPGESQKIGYGKPSFCFRK